MANGTKTTPGTLLFPPVRLGLARITPHEAILSPAPCAEFHP